MEILPHSGQILKRCYMNLNTLKYIGIPENLLSEFVYTLNIPGLR